jgi:hypothetical protein
MRSGIHPELLSVLVGSVSVQRDNPVLFQLQAATIGFQLKRQYEDYSCDDPMISSN